MNRILNITKWIFNPFLIQRTDQLKVVVFCVLIATTFWFLNAFNKTYTTTYSYPIEYKYDKEKFIPLEPLRESVEISLTGQGWDLLKEAFSPDGAAIEIELTRLPGVEYISARTLENRSKDLLQQFQVNQVFGDSIKCNFDYKISKLIDLELPKDSIALGNGYAIVSDVELAPSQVHITGPSAILDSIPDMFALSLDELVEDDFDDEVIIRLPDRVSSDISEVNVRFDIAPYVEMRQNIRFDIVTKDTTLVIKPREVTVRAYLPEKNKSSLSDTSITVQLDLSKFKYESDTMLPLKVIQFPSFVKYVMMEDSLVQVTRP